MRPNLVDRISWRIGRLASLAGTKTCILRIGHCFEEAYVLAKGLTTFALRPAEDAGGCYRVKETRGAIALTELLPCTLCIDLLTPAGHWLHSCELNVVRHALMLRDLRFRYTPILAGNSE